LTTSGHLLVCAIASYTFAGLFDPDKANISRLLRESEMSRSTWNSHGKRAWNIANSIIYDAGGDEYPHTIDPIDDDFEKLVGTIAACELLAIGLIRMHARDAAIFETDCLDDVWHQANIIRIHPE
jgi:hypothetical protein